jgi:anaerobic selenocysteine-containing dehydrogenase
LVKKEPAPFVEVHPEDAAKEGIADGMPVTVRSRRGSASAAARITDAIKPGTCFMPFHWGGLWGDAVVNQATLETFDPVSKQPELKHCAIRLERGR